MDGSRNSRSALQPQQTRRIKLNVGGELFETTAATLLSAGPDSLLAALASGGDLDCPIFIDRDPEIFSVLLSLLRTNRLPSSALRFSKQDLAEESLYYGLESRLRSAVSPPPLSGIDASLVHTIRPASDSSPSAFSAFASDGSLCIAHGGQISAYDYNLTHLATVRTHLEDITSIRRVYPDLAAVGSQSAAGLHFYDLSAGRHVGSAHWTDSTDPRIYKTKVFAIAEADSTNSVFASFDSAHRENCIIQVDKSTLQITAELGRQSGNSAKAMVAGKLKYLPESGAVFGSAVSFGAFGYAGYMRVWDPRCGGKVVWETNEPGSGRSSSRFGDSFADVDVDVEEGLMFKVGSKSGDVAMADMRNLGEDPWVYLEEKNHSLRNTGGGENSVVHCYGKQVFVGRERGLEVWSRVRKARDEDDGEDGGGRKGGYRRNLVDRVEECGGEKGSIRSMEGGGERLFVSREGLDGIEVWESSTLAGAISVL